MDLASIQGWIDVMGGHGCKGIKGAVQIVNCGFRMGRESPLRSRLIGWEEIESESREWMSLRNTSGQSEGMVEAWKCVRK